MSHPHPELGPPPKLPEGGLRVTPLGGLGEIGRNMTVFEYGGRLLIVDCGVLFPEEEQPGIDLILPDFTSIRDRLDDIDGIVLTHGHEDHIGGVPFLLRREAGHPADRLQADPRPDRGQAPGAPHPPVHPRGRRRATASASAPSTASSSRSTTPSRTPSPSPSAPPRAWWSTPATSRWTSSRWTAASPTCTPSPGSSEEGIDLLLSDSTNAEVPGFVPPERDISNVLRQVFASAQKRIIVASFASHVHRIQQILDAAHEYGRRVAFVGRSMVRNMGIARDLGYLKVPAGPGRRRQDARRPAGRRGRAGLHGLPGRADGRPVPDGQPRPPDPHRPGRHGDPGVVPHPGQRERGLPRDQRPDPLGRQRRPQGQRQGPCLRPRLGRRAAVLLQHLQAART